jgi:hypothetical protein
MQRSSAGRSGRAFVHFAFRKPTIFTVGAWLAALFGAFLYPPARAGLQNQDFPGIVVYAVDDPVVPADPDAPISKVPRPPHLPGSAGLWVLGEALDGPEHPLIFTARKAAHGLAGSSGEDHLVQDEATLPLFAGQFSRFP